MVGARFLQNHRGEFPAGDPDEAGAHGRDDLRQAADSNLLGIK
jgi:hypothetical protein